MAGGPVRLPLDELDAKLTEQLRKVLATLPAQSIAKHAITAKKPAKAAIVMKKKAATKRTR
ncbi:MAG: 4-hydroxy-tetrahydrodipicolinate synthase, partial [Methanoregula sp.]|nr:4-hydroxy-tetrahydrodipicolinate synthase [Methanoregula sp.]